jgi:hypothetical protein
MATYNDDFANRCTWQRHEKQKPRIGEDAGLLKKGAKSWLSSYLGFQFLSEHMLGHGAYLLIYDLAVLEHQQRRDAADAELHRRLRVSVYVYLADDGFAFVFACQFFYYGAYHAAGAAPFGPEVHEYWLVRVDNLLEVGVGYFNCFVRHDAKVLLVKKRPACTADKAAR